MRIKAPPSRYIPTSSLPGLRMVFRWVPVQFGLILFIGWLGPLWGQLIETQSPTAVDVIKARGFIPEMYTIQTSQGYPLTLYRIINPLADQATLNKYPVLYGHGILYDAMSMISRSENSRPRKPVLGQATINYGNPLDGSNDFSLPFMFSNNNFDVWLFDSKGTNSYNRNLTVEINPDKANKFWDFSLDEQALIDLPLMIDFVLAKTASTGLVYVGYSESTFFMFALLSTAPEYQSKIVAFISLAPVTYVSHIRGLTLPILAPVAGLTPEFFHNSFVPQPVIETVNTALRNPCRIRMLSELICGALINGIGGRGVGEQSPTFFVDFFKSTSLKAVKHFLQLFIGKRFGMYDYGVLENLRRYGQAQPPAYDLSRIKSDRLILARGGSDFLSTPEDQAQLIRELGTKPHLDMMIPQYNHFDFIDGKDLIRKVNEPSMLAVYELMYRSSPDILRSPMQNLAIARANVSTNANLGFGNTNPGSAELATSRLIMNRHVDHDNPLLRNSANLISTLTGARDVFKLLTPYFGR